MAAARKIIEINPEFPEGWLALGVVAEAKGEKRRVSEAEQRIKELDPTILERFNKQRSAQGCYRDIVVTGQSIHCEKQPNSVACFRALGKL